MEYINLTTILIGILLAAYLYMKKVRYNYWKRRGLPYVEPEFFYGNMKRSIKGEVHMAEDFGKCYREFKRRGLKHGGMYFFFNPVYLPVDPELIKNILHKDFDHFVNHGNYHNEEADPLSGHLVNLENAKWKNLRAKLSPTFTSGKMKMMFQTLVACSDELEKLLNDQNIRDAVDIKEIMARFTTDVIGSCAFGLDCDSLRNPDSEFRKFGKDAFTPRWSSTIRRILQILLPRSLLKAIGFRVTRKSIEDFFMKVVKDTVDYREKNNVIRKDFMHLLLQLKNKGEITAGEEVGDVKANHESDQPFLTMNEMAAQCFVFFLAGFETSSTTMTFALLELAQNQEIQDKLRDEIRSVLKKNDNKLTYEDVMEMTYLDKVVNETLRKHPPAPVTGRVCNKEYHVPGTDVVIEPGIKLFIPISSLHSDPEYYPNPDVFDPERFSEENKAKRPPCTFIPFGDGPRMCIGMRFGVMQSKVGLIKVIKNFRVTLNEKTITPIKLESRTAIASVKGDVWLNIAKTD